MHHLRFAPIDARHLGARRRAGVVHERDVQCLRLGTSTEQDKQAERHESERRSHDAPPEGSTWSADTEHATWAPTRRHVTASSMRPVETPDVRCLPYSRSSGWPELWCARSRCTPPKNSNGSIGSPFQYLPSAGQRMIWKCRCGVSFGALPVVPT